MVVFTALLFLTSAASDWVLIRQAASAKTSAEAAASAAKTARETLDQMEKGSATTASQTDSLIRATQSTANAAAEQASNLRGQLAAMEESNRTTREAMISGQRAYIQRSDIQAKLSPTGVTIPKGQLPEHISFITMIENSGNTPPLVAWVYGTYGSEKEQLARFIMPMVDKKMLLPQALGVKEPGKGALEIPLSILADPDKAPFLWGWIAYYDVFPNTPLRLTEYCTALQSFAYNRDTREIQFRSSDGFGGCRDYNCRDENCENYEEFVKLNLPRSAASTPPRTRK